MTEKVYTIKELSDIFKVSEKVVRDIINMKEIEAFKFGKEWRVTEEALQKYIEKTKNI
jgi:excisionase family DNA binding protein